MYGVGFSDNRLAAKLFWLQRHFAMLAFVAPQAAPEAGEVKHSTLRTLLMLLRACVGRVCGCQLPLWQVAYPGDVI